MDKEAIAGFGGRHDDPIRGYKEDVKSIEVEGRVEGRSEFESALLRLIRNDPRQKSKEFINRLKRVMSECDMVVSDPEVYASLLVKAMVVLHRAIQGCCDMVTDDRCYKLGFNLRR